MGRGRETGGLWFHCRVGGGSGRPLASEAEGLLKQNSASGCKLHIQQSQIKSIKVELSHPVLAVLVTCKEISH